MRVRGQVCRVIEGRDFGFIEVRDVDEDVFFHLRDVPCTVQSVAPGTWLEFEIVTRKGKARAKYITAPGAYRVKELARQEFQESHDLASKVVLSLAVCEGAALVYKAALDPKVWGIVLAFVALMNVVAVGLIQSDKESAQMGAWRISEGSLLLPSLLGGWPATWYAMQRFRHKTSKGSFLAMYALLVVVHVVVLVPVMVGL